MKKDRALPAAVCLILFFTASAVLLARLPGCSLLPALVMALLLSAAAYAALRTLGLRGRLGLCCAVIAALLMWGRLFCFTVETSDYTDFLLPWTERLRALGGFRGLGKEISNYNVPYMVLLALFSCMKTPALYLIKLTSCLFDLLLAAVLGLLTGRLGGGQTRKGVCFLLALALPTVFINGAVWGQCDSIYVSLALLGLLLCITERPAAGLAAFALSFAFKLQAVFLLPILLPLLLSGRIKWFHLPIFPAVYVLAVSPAMLAGRGVWETLSIYLSTAATAGSGLNYNSPSMYSLPYFFRLMFSSDMTDYTNAARAGVIAAGAFCLTVCLLFLLRRKHITERSILFASLLLCCGIPLLLPHMHDRYFYFCDVLTLAVACLLPAAAPTVLLSQFASLLGYYAYFYLRYLLPMRYGFYGLVLTALLTAFLLADSLFSPKAEAEPGGGAGP